MTSTMTVSSKNVRLPFCGVDGEGGDLDNGYHSYFLLRVGKQVLTPPEGQQRLTSLDILTFLDKLSRDRVYVVYFGDYDVTKWLEDLPFPALDALVHREKRTGQGHGRPWPIRWHGFQIEYLPRKEFKLRRELRRWANDDGRVCREYTPWLVINDVGSFFQCRFGKTLEQWDVGTPEQRAAIEVGKGQRGSFVIADLEEIGRYNALEIELLEQLMTKFRSACVDIAVVPQRWQGPGLLAEALLRKYKVAPTKDVPLFQSDLTRPLVEAAGRAFYGGRPEVMAIGPVDRPLWQWDINSAYPYAMLSVPCLEHGKWSLVEGGRPGYQLAICYGSFRPSGRRTLWYGLPVRSKDGTIVYPAAGRGWYWSFEIDASIHQDFRAERCWVYESQCDCRPFDFVRDVYAERRRLGKDGPGTVLKLGLNSLYGKQVQSIGSPRFANPIWGSYVTAYCRSMIQHFIHTSPSCEDGECGNDIIMVATDSVVTWRRRKGLPVSDVLGEWSVEEHPRGMFIVQPGLYFGSSGKPAKTRGIPRTVVEQYEAIFRDAFETMVATQDLRDGDVQVPQKLFAGLRYTVHRHNMGLLGQWIEFADPETGKEGKTIRFDWSSKRKAYPVINPSDGQTYIVTFPQDGSPDVESVPYSKDIGGLRTRADQRLVYEEQPDWVDLIRPGEME